MRVRFELQSIAITIVLLAVFAALRLGRHEVAASGGTVHSSLQPPFPVAIRCIPWHSVATALAPG